MSIPENADYFQPSKGSLSGFESVKPSDSPINVPQVGWSIEQLRAFLTNQSDVNFPTEDFVRRVDELINSHLNNFNNPHRVTLDQVIGNIVEDVIGNVLPGTAPTLPPFFAYDADCPLPLGAIYPAEFTSTNLYRMTEGGIFVNPADELVLLGTDYLLNKPGIPLFSTITNYTPQNWHSLSTIKINTNMAVATLPTFNLPFSLYTVSENNNTGNFGIFIPFTRQANTVYTTSFFVLSTIEGGSLIISQLDDPENTMTVKLADGSYKFSSSDILGETIVYPSGIVRVSVTFKTPSTSSPHQLQLIHLNDNETDPERVGENGRALFSIGYPITTQSTLNQPVLINPTQLGSTSPLVFDLSSVNAPQYLSEFTFSLAINLYKSLPDATLSDTLIFQFDKLTLERDKDTVYLKLNGNVVFTSSILPGFNVYTVSYSPTKIQFKNLNQPKKILTGSFDTLLTNNAKAGPCAGYLHYLSLYALSDTNQMCEYLTNA